MALTDNELADLRAALKRCSDITIEAAIRYRETGDVPSVEIVVAGIIRRYMTPENDVDLATASDDTKLVEDLGIDSLTMLEIVLTIEEALDIRIQNEELIDIQTLGQVKTFIKKKISGEEDSDESSENASESKKLDRDAITIALPQNPPFLFLDEATINGDVVLAKYHITGDEYFLEGHFKDNPVFPASIVFEAMGQAACLWVLQNVPQNGDSTFSATEVVFASMDDAHFHKRAVPGDTIEMEIKLDKLRSPLAIFKGAAKVKGERLAELGHLVLAFGPQPADAQNA
ncbi:MAG: phosphopantetheine-binding protein [Verrucomicrobiota bacterium]